MGTYGNKGKKFKNNSPHPNPKRKKQGPSQVHVKPSHWLHEISILKIICHCFLPRLMEGQNFGGIVSNVCA
jgi:hypothetical protein